MSGEIARNTAGAAIKLEAPAANAFKDASVDFA